MTDPIDDSERHPLAPLAGEPVAPLDSASRDRIESALRVQYAARTGAGRPSRPRWLIAVPALAVLLAVATVALVARDTVPVAALELNDADGVTITLPDGSTVIDPADGFLLADGAVVMVRDAGSVRIDDVTLSGETTVTVRDGQLVTDVVATTTTDRPSHLDPGPEPSQPPDELRSTTTTTTPPATTTTARPVDDTPPPEPTDRPPPTEPVEPESEPPRGRDRGDGQRGEGRDRDDEGLDVAVALRVQPRDGAIRVSWNASGVDGRPWTVVVVRATDGSTPAGPAEGSVIGDGRKGEVVERGDELPDEPVSITYRVFVVDEAGGVVAASAAQTFTPPDS
ncbi:MAG: hypothetical protein AAF548_15580 [Actinomycetota bacterium]